MLDARSDDDVQVTCADRGRAVERSLQGRAALAVDRAGSHGLGPAGDEQGDAADVERLLADLRHAAHLHVLHLARVDVDPLHETVQRSRREIVRADVGQRPVPLADRGANRLDDEGVAHEVTVPPHTGATIPTPP